MSGSATKAAKRNGRMAVRLSEETTPERYESAQFVKEVSHHVFEVEFKTPPKAIGFCPA
jgi:hypothetical protein